MTRKPLTAEQQIELELERLHLMILQAECERMEAKTAQEVDRWTQEQLRLADRYRAAYAGRAGKSVDADDLADVAKLLPRHKSMK